MTLQIWSLLGNLAGVDLAHGVHGPLIAFVASPHPCVGSPSKGSCHPSPPLFHLGLGEGAVKLVFNEHGLDVPLTFELGSHGPEDGEDEKVANCHQGMIDGPGSTPEREAVELFDMNSFVSKGLVLGDIRLLFPVWTDVHRGKDGCRERPVVLLCDFPKEPEDRAKPRLVALLDIESWVVAADFVSECSIVFGHRKTLLAPIMA